MAGNDRTWSGNIATAATPGQNRSDKRVFFSFHYQDVIDFRANVVRNHWVTKPDRGTAGFFDASIWESTKKTGSTAIKRLINSGLNNTTATTVLIGSHTYSREWVRYEIIKSIEVGNKLVGVHINQIPDKYKTVKAAGANPFDYLGVSFSADGKKIDILEYNGSQWITYEHIPTIPVTWTVAPQFLGTSHKLSAFYNVYCWQQHVGYQNFATWVE